MADIFIISDTHFSHGNTLKFLVPDWAEDDFTVRPLRPMRPFASVEEMDEALIDNWNRVVRPQDKVYHLGDVAMKKSASALLGRVNGHKRLVRGNHDIFDDKYYRPFFESIYGSRLLEDFLLTHIPIHPQSLRRNWVNVHGHVHNNIEPGSYGPRYVNVLIEVTDYRPLAIEEVRQLVKAQCPKEDRDAAAHMTNA